MLNYNIYGFNLGGPLYIPKVYNKNHDKTFFFWNEEWRKINQGNTPNVVPTLAAQDIPTAGQDLTYVTPLFATNGTNNGKPYVPGAVVPYSGAAAVAAGVQNVYFEPCLQASVTNKDACQAALLTQYNLAPGSPWPNNTIPHAAV